MAMTVLLNPDCAPFLLCAVPGGLSPYRLLQSNAHPAWREESSGMSLKGGDEPELARQAVEGVCLSGGSACG